MILMTNGNVIVGTPDEIKHYQELNAKKHTHIDHLAVDVAKINCMSITPSKFAGEWNESKR